MTTLDTSPEPTDDIDRALARRQWRLMARAQRDQDVETGIAAIQINIRRIERIARLTTRTLSSSGGEGGGEPKSNVAALF